MKTSAPDILIFDWDNTLVDTWPIIHAALHRTFEEFGMEPWPMEKVKARVRKSMRDSFPEIFGEEWEKAGARYQRHYRASHLQKLNPLPGAEALLRAMQARGTPMLVVSNKKGVNLRQEVAHLGWSGFFDGVIGADDAARDKPYPDPVHLALEALEVKPGPNIWFIGDSEIDLECASACGCTAVLYGDYAQAHAEFTPTHYRGHAYTHYVKDHAALRELLDSSW